MKRFAAALFSASVFVSPALAQNGGATGGNGGVTPSGTITTGHCAQFASGTSISDAGSACGSGGGGGAGLGANTFTGQQTLSGNGGASAPNLLQTGTPYSGGTGTTTWPLWLAQPAGTTSSNWNTAGTMLGLNSASGFTGNLFDFQANGTSRASLSNGGTLTLAGNITASSSATISMSGNSGFSSNHSGHIHIPSNGAAPTISACGTSPSADTNGNDGRSTITVGSGSPTSCTITFNTAYTSFNHCVVTAQSSLAAFAYSYTKTAITITGTALSGNLDVSCEGS